MLIDEKPETQESIKPRRVKSRSSSYVRRERVRKQGEAAAFRRVERPAVERATSTNQILDAYVRRLIAENSPSLVTLQSMIDLWLRPGFGDLHPDEVTLALQEAWLKSTPGESNTKSSRYACLRAAFEQGRREGLIDHNPIDLPRSARPSRRPREGFDAAAELVSIKMLIRLVTDPRIPPERRDMYLMLAVTGMRIGELIALIWADILWSREHLAAIFVSKNFSRKDSVVRGTKTGTTRDVPITPPLHSRLWKRWRGGWAAQHWRTAEATDLVFARHGEDGPRPLADHHVLKRFHRDLALIGEAPRRVHALRHSFVSNWCEAGADEKAIREITHPREVSPRGGSFGVYRHVSWAEKCRAILAVDLEGVE